MGNPLLRRLLTSASLATMTVLAAPASAQVDAELVFNQNFQGTISEQTDADLIEFSETADSKLTLIATRKSASVSPKVELLDQSMAVINTTGFYTQTGTKGVLKKFKTPYTGTYFARVSAANGLTGAYKLQIKGNPPKKSSESGTIGTSGEIDGIAFVARAGSTLSGLVKRTSGDLSPAVVELIGPGGGLVSVFGKTSLNGKGTKLKLSKINLPLLGDYTLRITGQGGTTGDYISKLVVTAPNPAKGSIYEADHPNDPGNSNPAINLDDVLFGRGLRTPDGLSMDVVSPLSLVVTDPISDLPIKSTLEPLFAGGDLKSLFPFNLGPLFAPPVVPRNGVLVLRFDKSVALESLNLVDGHLGPDSPIQISMNGASPPIQAFVSGKDVILNGATMGNSGFPPSPVALDASGNPVASVFGNGRLTLTSVGPNKVKSLSGGEFEPRKDLLGSPDAGGTFIGFNPGNQILDFFKQTVAGGVLKGYTGFLPDERSPRIIREHRFEGNYTPNLLNPSAGDILAVKSFTVLSNVGFNTVAKKGLGEWAGGVLRLRPGASDEEELIIVQNTTVSLGGGLFKNELFLQSPVKVPIGAGQPYAIVRAEYFEPDPDVPLDADVFDPFNPENANNSSLLNFVEIIDPSGVIQDATLPVNPRSSILMRFNEPMAAETFRAFESFFVTSDPPSSSPGANFLGRVALSDGGKVATFFPERVIQYGPSAGTFENVGFGKGPLALRFHVNVVPEAEVIQGHVGAAGLLSFLAQGERGITDVGGQPLAFALTDISATSLTLDYSFAFATAADVSIVDHGAIVHRFKGQPKTGTGADGETGVAYADIPKNLCGPAGLPLDQRNNIYGPRIADLNLFANGFLAGAPVQFIQKIHDNFNPPPTGQLSPFPFGTSTPIGGASVLGGAKMQHVYRAVDASPDWEVLAGTVLDLTQLAYAPSGGSVFNTTIPDFQVHAGHSWIVPDTKQGGGIPSMPQSGLTQGASPSNSNVFGGHHATLGDESTNYIEGPYNGTVSATGADERRQLLYGSSKPGTTTDFYDGKPFVIDNSQLFQPPGTQHPYHPLPHNLFDNFFPYNNGSPDVHVFNSTSGHNGQPTWGGNSGEKIPQSMILEYRVRVVDPDNPPSQFNSFTFAVGILSSALPRFRVYTLGTGCSSCCTSGATQGGTAGGCKNTCSFFFSPAMTGLPGSGGNPLDPDLIKNAGGPDPAPPSLNCYCLPAPTPSAIPCPMGTGTQTNNLAPNIESVAYGTAANPAGNNYGDNSRYFMLFNYVKRESTIQSPFVRAQPDPSVINPIFLAPAFDPPLSDLPVGTSLDVSFRASTVGIGAPGDATAFLTPEEMANTNNVINNTANTPFLQFRALSQGNTSTQLAPVMEEVVIPYRLNN